MPPAATRKTGRTKSIRKASTERGLLAIMISATVLTGVPRRAAADEGSCSAVQVVERGELGAAWQDAISVVRSRVAHLDAAACSATTVVVEASPPGARVHVAGDGRQAERTVATPENLGAIVLGLLAAIPAESPPTPARPAPWPVDPDDVPKFEKPMERAATPHPSPVGFHVAPALGARFGHPTPVGMLDAGARLELRAYDWLVFLSGRYAFVGERVQGPRIPGWSYDEVALGVGLGRRWHLGEVALDLALVPELVVVTEEGNDPVDGVGGTAEELRVQAVARAVAPVGGHLRPTLQLDTEATPLSLASPTRVDPGLPPLPAWTIGAGAGIVWDVP